MKKTFVLSTLAVTVLTLFSCKRQGYVEFHNRSVTNRSYDVVWDGSVIATLYPQEDSEQFEVNEGHHTLRFEFSNSGDVACDPADPNITADYISTFTCSQ